jgi:hypothetical protein
MVQGFRSGSKKSGVFCMTSFPTRPHSLYITINPLTPNDILRRGAVSALKIKIRSKNMREKPINTQIIHSVY